MNSLDGSEWVRDLLNRLSHQHDGPLRDRLVVQVSTGLAANFAGSLLSDFGACVVMVEDAEGDALRRGGRRIDGEDSLYFQTECRNKYSICVPDGSTSIIEALAAVADVFVEDLGPGHLEDIGLGSDRLLELNPKLCVLRISPFGQTGPRAHESGDDRTAQAFSGVTNVTGYTDQTPIHVAVPIADYWTGLQGANGALIALLASDSEGAGQVIDLALYEAALRVQEEAVIQYDQLDIVRARMGNEYAETVPSNHYETSDNRWVAISAAGDAPFARVCEAIGNMDAIADSRFSTTELRRTHRDAVNELIGSWVREHELDVVVDRFALCSAPIATVQSSLEIARDPHIAERRNLIEGSTMSGLPLTYIAPVPRLTNSDISTVRSAPTHDQHGPILREWARELGRPRDLPAPDSSLGEPALEADGALTGLRVLDLGQFIAAPFAATLLAEFGAEVIKVELPSGDGTRTRFPERDGVGLSFLVTNRGKRSITLDLHHEESVEILRQLVAESDVLLENFRPGTLERFGLAPEVLWKINPKLVIGRLSGFGQTGPYRDRSAFDRIGLAMGGISYVGGHADRPPLRPGVLAADYSCGMFGLLGVLCSLVGISHGDAGRIVDVSLYESILRMMGDTCALYSSLGEVRERNSAKWPLYSYSITDTSVDGIPLTVSPPSVGDPLEAIAAVTGSHDGAEVSDRLLRRWIKSNVFATVDSAVRESGWSCSRVNTVEEIVTDPHILARENVVSIEHHTLGPVRMQGIIPRLSRTPGKIGDYSRFPGSDNDYVFRNLLGRSVSDIQALEQLGAI